MRQAKGMVAKRHGPDEAKIKELLERTGYKHEVTNKGRVYGPPPDVEEKPEHKQEIFVGKLARDVYEDELVPLFEKFGKIFDIKILTDPASGFNRGFAFVNYCEKPCLYEAAKAVSCSVLKCFRENHFCFVDDADLEFNYGIAKL